MWLSHKYSFNPHYTSFDDYCTNAHQRLYRLLLDFIRDPNAKNRQRINLTNIRGYASTTLP
jgi:hypothetical protein